MGKTENEAWERFRRRINSAESFEWAPEVPIRIQAEAGCVDIYLSLDNAPVLVVENKITADVPEGQLEKYGGWLANNGVSDAALVLLTHSTAPPVEFLEPGKQKRYGVHLRSVCSWLEVYE